MGISRKNSGLDIELREGKSKDVLSLVGFTPLEKVHPVRNSFLTGQADFSPARDKSLTGFTLLEVLIAVILFTVGTLSLIAALNSGIFSVSDVEKTRLALNIAQANMELIKSKSFTDIDTDAEISNLVSNLGFSNFTVSSNVAEGQNPMQADVTVNWNVKGGSTGFTLTTLIADYSTQ